MQKQFTAPTHYFLQEGRANLRECLNIAFKSATQQNVAKLIIFTAKGEGVRLALDSFLSLEEYRHIQLVAVTFPAGQSFTDQQGTNFTVQIPETELAFFREKGVPLVRAHLPFDQVAPFYRHHGELGQGLAAIGQALNMFCGSMSLCVQAITLACDAGFVALGEHVISLTSDTAILAQATSTHRMIGELVIREILCKPVVMSIVRREVAEKLPRQLSIPLENPGPIIIVNAEHKDSASSGSKSPEPHTKD